MSLFKTIEYWSTQSEDDEYFDQNSLLLTRLNFCDFELVITGSQSGVLRIFKSSGKRSEGLDPTDLIIEKVFDAPILQVGCGKFISGDHKEQLVLLHPRSVAICSLQINGSQYGSQNYLETMYEHKLSRSAFNCAIGPFGGAQNRDFICVQSLDGLLIFFEQESASFSCYLPQMLLPGPIIYVKKTDMFVIQDGNWCIQAYKYKILSQMGEDNGNIQNAFCDWSYNLAEPILDIDVVEEIDNKTLLLVLGDRNLFCFNSSGNLKFMKKLDYPPTAFCSYVSDNNVITLITSETETLLIYQNTTLKWSAKLPFAPICIRRAFLENMAGALVVLSEEGRLECCYLGTEPMLFMAPPLKQTEIDNEKLPGMLKDIKDMKNGNDIQLLDPTTKKDLKITIKVEETLKNCSFETNLKNIDNRQMCNVNIDLSPQTVFQEIQVTSDVCTPLKITPQVHFFENFSEKAAITSSVYLSDDLDVPSLKLDVITTTVSSLGVPKCTRKSIILPLGLVTKPGEAKKDEEHKITLNISQNQVPLLTLFRDFALEDALHQTANSIYFHAAQQTVGILCAKSSQRYRIQSDSFSALSLFIEQVIHRLQVHSASKEDFKVTYNFNLPSKEVVKYVTEHFKKKKEVIELQEELLHYTSQYRMFQKRLIQKLKIKNPTQLRNTEILLEDTYKNILSIADSLDCANIELTESQTKLSCCLQILEMLIRLANINESLKQFLVSLFCKCHYHLEAQKWEEILDVNLCYILRNELAKSKKEKMRLEQFNSEDVVDLSRINKHLVQVLERITSINTMGDVTMSANQKKGLLNNSPSTEILSE